MKGYVFGFVALSVVGIAGFAMWRHSQRQDAIAQAEIEAIKAKAAQNQSATGNGGPFATVGRGLDAISDAGASIWNTAKKWF